MTRKKEKDSIHDSPVYAVSVCFFNRNDGDLGENRITFSLTQPGGSKSGLLRFSGKPDFRRNSGGSLTNSIHLNHMNPPTNSSIS
jgi:hypothetical protein